MLIALALLAQAQPAQAQLPPANPPAREVTPGNDLYFQELRTSSPAARATMQAFGACTVGNSAERAAQVTRMDFTTSAYRSGLQTLARNNEGCLARRRGRMQSANLLFAGAIAEALIERDPTPLNVRLARAAQQPATQAFGPLDVVAICVVRGMPDQTAALFAADTASDAETAAINELQPAVRACASGRAIQSSPAGLRAILATAAFRTVDGGSSTAQRH